MRAERAHKVEMGEEAADRAPPARRSMPAPDEREPRRTLPPRLTSFIGRERELAEVAALLHAHRLVTLTGAPGVGKTRLGLEVANTVSAEFPDGVWLVELASLADSALVPQSVAAALGVRELPGRDATATLGDYLRPRSLLLVLDNCEHLVAAVAALAEVLLRACPDLRVLVTSREPLVIEGEVTWRVPSLTVPNVEPVRAAGDDTAAALVASEAARLFVERAQAAAPDFVVTGRNAPAIATICARLDGIPLALELAAARVRALSVEQIAARLDDRFRLLTGGSRTALPRYRTLRGAVEWSYDLLTESERALLRRLAVFAGGWTLEAVEAVCADDLLASTDVLDLLVALVDKSLVQVNAADADEARYGLLEMLRQFGAEQLVARSELASLRTRHRDYFLAWIEDIVPALTGPSEVEALNRIEREHDNLRAALAWTFGDADVAGTGSRALAAGEPSSPPAVVLRLVGGMWPFWRLHSHIGEGRRWLERALAVTPSRPTPSESSARAWVLYGAAQLSMYQSDYRVAVERMTEALALWRGLGDDRHVAMALERLGYYLAILGEYERAADYSEQNVALARSLGDRRLLAAGLFTAANVAWRLGRFEQAAAYAEESVAEARESGNTSGSPTGSASWLGRSADWATLTAHGRLPTRRWPRRARSATGAASPNRSRSSATSRCGPVMPTVRSRCSGPACRLIRRSGTAGSYRSACSAWRAR